MSYLRSVEPPKPDKDLVIQFLKSFHNMLCHGAFVLPEPFIEKLIIALNFTIEFLETHK